MTFVLSDLGASDAPELVALANDELVVFVDVSPDFLPPNCFRCKLVTGGAPAVGLGLGAGNIELGDEEGGDDEKILLTLAPAAGGPAELVAFSASLIEEHHVEGAPCFSWRSPQVGSLRGAEQEEDFGVRIAVGSSANGLGVAVALATPSTGRVYALPSLTAAGPVGGNTRVLSGDSAALDFGAALAFGDLDGRGHDVLVVGDPGAPAGGQAGAGVALVFDVAADPAELLATLHDSAPEPEQAFGRALAVTRFAADADADAEERTDLLVVGAAGEIFTYFRALLDADDPRL
jgi:hypothetical protein